MDFCEFEKIIESTMAVVRKRKIFEDLENVGFWSLDGDEAFDFEVQPTLMVCELQDCLDYFEVDNGSDHFLNDRLEEIANLFLVIRNKNIKNMQEEKLKARD